MSGNAEEENKNKKLETLNSMLGGYQKRTLTLSRKRPKNAPEETDKPDNSDSESEVEQAPPVEDLPEERDELPLESVGESELPEEVSYAPSEGEETNGESSEFSRMMLESLPDKLPELPNFSGLQNKPIVAPSEMYNTAPSPPKLVPVHKKAPKDNRRISPLTVVTYNMWFGEENFTKRVHLLMKVVVNAHKYKPDLICLQEVTPQSYQLLQQGLGQFYYLFEIFGDPPARYSNLIAINKETMDIVDESSLGYYDLPETQMSRKLMICHVVIKKTGTKFHILNTHLESFDSNWKNRQQQIEFIDQILEEEKVENFLLCGDFNICRDDEPIESHLRLAGYQDVWMEMGSPQSLKYTYNGDTNPYAKKGYKSRLDRILYRFGDTDKVAVTKMKLLGVREPHPSDHYGVLTEFLIKRIKK